MTLDKVTQTIHLHSSRVAQAAIIGAVGINNYYEGFTEEESEVGMINNAIESAGALGKTIKKVGANLDSISMIALAGFTCNYSVEDSEDSVTILCPVNTILVIYYKDGNKDTMEFDMELAMSYSKEESCGEEE